MDPDESNSNEPSPDDSNVSDPDASNKSDGSGELVGRAVLANPGKPSASVGLGWPDKSVGKDVPGGPLSPGNPRSPLSPEGPWGPGGPDILNTPVNID